MTSAYQTPPKPPRRSTHKTANGGSAGRLASPLSSPAGLAASTPPPAAYTSPRTPDMLPGEKPPRSTRVARSTHNGSGTDTPPSPSDDASSLASGTTASFSIAADAALFAPSSVEDAVSAVPSLLSQLLSGRTDEQVLAARKLHAYCHAGGRPVQAAISAAGGVHMLLIMLDSLDRTLRDLCTRILTELCQADDAVRSELLRAPGGPSKVVQLMYRGIMDGQAAAGKFLEALAASDSEAVQAALCHAKVVRMLVAALDKAPTPRARAATLSALQAFCQHDSSNLRKLVWSGGAEALVGVLQSVDSSTAQHTAALELLCLAVSRQPDAATALSTVTAVEALSGFVGAPLQPVALQAHAAEVLAAVAAGGVRRPGVQQALTDHALPRALEIVHETAADYEAGRGSLLAAPGCLETGGRSRRDVGGGTSKAGGQAAAAQQQAGEGGADEQLEAAARRRLQVAAAGIVAELAVQDRECCHSLLLHTQLLRPAVAALIASGRCAAAKQLLDVSHAYAASLGAHASDAAGGRVGASLPCSPLAVRTLRRPA